jgi:sulfur carrier protein
VAAFLRDRTAVVKKAKSSYGVGFVIVILNGEERPLEDGRTVADLLDELRLGGRRVAVELNRDIVPAAEYASRTIREGDTIEIVQFVGGG